MFASKVCSSLEPGFYIIDSDAVKQEIARLGILPIPEFWAKTTRLDTPGPALLLHWVFSSIFIIATPLGSVNGYLVFSTLFNYSRTIIAGEYHSRPTLGPQLIDNVIVVLGSALLVAPLLRSFDVLDRPWRPRGTKLGFWSVVPLTVIYVLANLFVFVVSWFPSDLQNALHTKSRILSGYVGPTIVMCIFGAGALYWAWDIHILPILGYRLERNREVEDGLDIHVNFTVSLEYHGPRAAANRLPAQDSSSKPRGVFHGRVAACVP